MGTEQGRIAQETHRAGQSWQDVVEDLSRGYREQWRRAAERNAGLVGLRWLGNEAVMDGVQRLASATQEVTAAQVGVAGAWLRAPLWLSGATSPQEDLQQSYSRLFEAQRGLVRIYLGAVLSWQRSLMGATEQAVERAGEAADAGVESARAEAGDLRAAGEAVTSAAHTADVATAGGAPTATGEAARLIKGNINRDGEKIYHLPGQLNYDRVEADQLFETEEQAQAAGFRPAQR